MRSPNFLNLSLFLHRTLYLCVLQHFLQEFGRSYEMQRDVGWGGGGDGTIIEKIRNFLPTEAHNATL
jgi:hypothetical protein